MKHRKQGLKILPHSSLLGGSIAANRYIKHEQFIRSKDEKGRREK